MSDLHLTILSAIAEIGIPAGILAAAYFKPNWRKRLFVLLGALTPISFCYLAFFFVLPFLKENRNADNIWANHAIWIMSFGAFALSFVIGVLLSFLKKPENLNVRFLVGFLPPTVIALVGILRAHPLF